MQPEIKREKIHKAFVITVIINGLIGLADLSVAAFFIFKKNIINLLDILAGNHYIEGLALKLQSALINLSTHTHRVAVFYFLSHGFIKVFLTWALLKNKLWAYPLAIVFFSLFSFYQLIYLPRNHTAFDFTLLFVNLIVLIFVAREYKNLRKKV